MSHDARSTPRRRFLAICTLAIAAGGSRSLDALAQSRVDEGDATAKSLGYRHDAAKVDRAKFGRYAEGQTCANCQLYAGKAGDAWAPCPIYANRLVNAKGWCNAYVKKG